MTRLAAVLALAAFCAAAACQDGVSVTRIEYGGWRDCIQVSNGQVDIVATTEVGPRIIRFGFRGDGNQFWENPADRGARGGDEWRIFGGHRLWHSPETKPRTYVPDNTPIEYIIMSDGMRLIEPVEKLTGIRKEIDIIMEPDEARVYVRHRLTNLGVWPVELAPWSLSAMAPGGVGVFPMPVGPSDPFGLLPNRTLALWPYTDMNDARVTWGKEYIILRQSDTATSPIKIGMSANACWAAYVNNAQCFVKTYEYVPGAKYPDGGCTVETYTNSDPNMLEVETLGPLTTLQPGASVEHVEQWFLFRGVRAGDTEEWARTTIAPLGRKALHFLAARGGTRG